MKIENLKMKENMKVMAGTRKLSKLSIAKLFDSTIDSRPSLIFRNGSYISSGIMILLFISEFGLLSK